MNAQKKAVILDSLQAKKIINQLIAGDVAKAENKLLTKMDSINRSRIKTLDSANKDLFKAYQDKANEVIDVYKSNQDKDKIISKQKNVNNFLKGFGLSSIITTIVVLLL